jgi:magnesium transporter
MSQAENLSDIEFDPATIAASLADEHAANIVETLNDHTPQEAAAIVLHFPPDRAIDILDQSGLECPTEIIDAMPREIAVTMLSGMSADRVADIFRHLEEESRADLLSRLDSETRLNLQRLLAYPEDTAGSIMTTEFVSVQPIGPSRRRLNISARSSARARRSMRSMFSIQRPRSSCNRCRCAG